MKKIFSLILALCLVGSLQAKTEDFNYDSKKVNAEFSQLNKAEEMVSTNSNVTVEEVQAATNVDLDTATVSAPAGELPAGIPAFWWGFCLGWIGLIVVYVVTDNDKDEVKKALKGCVISAVVGVVVYVVFFVLAAASTTL
jgi:hypothetical protein